MDAVEFLKLHRSYCKKNGWDPNVPDGFSPYADDETIERYVARVEQWDSEHPKETRQSKFLKLFPDADFCQNVIDISPCSIEKEMKKCCGDRECDECKRTYWLTEVTDNGND